MFLIDIYEEKSYGCLKLWYGSLLQIILFFMTYVAYHLNTTDYLCFPLVQFSFSLILLLSNMKT